MFQYFLLWFRTLEGKLDLIMADLTALKAASAQVQTDVNEAVAALRDLSTRLENSGDTTSQAEIDAVVEQLSGAGSTLDEAVAANDGVADEPTDPEVPVDPETPADPAPVDPDATPVDPANPDADPNA